MTKEVIQQLTPEEASELAMIEARIQRNEDAALEYVTDLREIKEKRLYRGMHGTFEDYCRERWGKTARAIRFNLESLSVKENLLENGKKFHTDSMPVITEILEKIPENSLRALSKVKQDKRVDVLLSAHKEAKGKKLSNNGITEAISKAAHKALPKKTEPERRGGFDACYGTGMESKPVAITGKRVTLEEFRLMASPSGLNVPNSATLHLLVNGTLTQVTSVKFNRADNELVLS